MFSDRWSWRLWWPCRWFLSFDFHGFYCSLTLNVTYWRPRSPLMCDHVTIHTPKSLSWISPVVIWSPYRQHNPWMHVSLFLAFSFKPPVWVLDKTLYILKRSLLNPQVDSSVYSQKMEQFWIQPPESALGGTGHYRRVLVRASPRNLSHVIQGITLLGSRWNSL